MCLTARSLRCCTRTKQSADRVATRLERAGVSADAIHGNKSQAARQRTLANFKANRTLVLVATDVAARGLDVDGISHVVNYDLPMEPETYVHRIGRTGRAGATGVAISFCDGQQRPLLHAIERLLKRKIPVEKIEMAAPGPVLAMPTVTPEPARHQPSESSNREQPRKEFRPRVHGKPAKEANRGSSGDRAQRRDQERRPQREQPAGPQKKFGKPKPRPGAHRRAEPATMPAPLAENAGEQPAAQPGETQHPFFRKHRSRPWWQRKPATNSGERRRPPRQDNR
jgi:ATP-dependent RNA helicase RhlE